MGNLDNKNVIADKLDNNKKDNVNDNSCDIFHHRN